MTTDAYTTDLPWFTLHRIADGEILGAQADLTVPLPPTGQSWIEGKYSPREGRIVDGAFAPYTPEEAARKANRPPRQSRWSNDTMEWTDERTLDELRADRVAALKDSRDAALNGGFDWDGSRFDSDETSQLRLLGLLAAAREPDYVPELWRLQDNSWRELQQADAIAVWSALKAHIKSCFQTFAVLEAQAMSAPDAETINSLTWPQ